MIKVLILGGNGMLGHACSQILCASPNLEVTKTSRLNLEGYVQFNAMTDSVSNLIQMTNPDWIVNCIGVIKPHINERDPNSVSNAIRINSLFPQVLASETQANIIQIATDCVYSGTKGDYLESDVHDALDVYGKSKSLGEAVFQNLIHLRASIIGPEIGRSTSLLEWFKNQPLNAEINGFSDHLWNGITTHHFGMIARGIITNNFNQISKAHIVPSGAIQKFQLLNFFAEAYSRNDIEINKMVSSNAINRTLATEYPEINQLIWSMSGYSEIPTVEQMVHEQANLSELI